MKKVAGYGRVSTTSQIEGTSLEDQERKIAEKCKREDYKLVDLYFDEGISGGSLERRQLQRMRDDAKAGKFEAVLFTKLDRLGRNARDIHNIWHEFSKELGINFICIDDPSINSEGKMGNLMVGMMASFAQFERETIRERTTNGRQSAWNKKEFPIGNHQIPYGYQKNEKTKQLEVIKEQAAIYKKIVSLYLVKRMSGKAIAIHLTREGISTPSSVKKIKKKSVRWSAVHILKMLKNPVYKGEAINNQYEYTYKTGGNGKFMAASKTLRPKEQWVKTEFPALISDERWQQIQDRITCQKQKPKRAYKGYEDHFLLDGFIYCGECGGKMRKKVKEEKDGKVRLYYTCYWRGCSNEERETSGRTACYLASVDAQKVDGELFKQIISLLTNPKRFIEIWFKDVNFDELQTKVTNLEKLEKTLYQRLTEGFKLYNSTEDDKLKKLYWSEQKKTEQDWQIAKSDLQHAKTDLSAISNKADRFKKFSEAVKKHGIKQRLKNKMTFTEFMESLPFSEKKRIVEAIVSPEKGGKCKVAYIRPIDFLDDDELKKMPKNERDEPLTDRPPQVYADFQLDLDRLNGVIRSLNRSDLLNKLEPCPIPSRSQYDD